MLCVLIVTVSVFFVAHSNKMNILTLSLLKGAERKGSKTTLLNENQLAVTILLMGSLLVLMSSAECTFCPEPPCLVSL